MEFRRILSSVLVIPVGFLLVFSHLDAEENDSEWNISVQTADLVFEPLRVAMALSLCL
jgi:hypothetical protein